MFLAEEKDLRRKDFVVWYDFSYMSTADCAALSTASFVSHNFDGSFIL